MILDIYGLWCEARWLQSDCLYGTNPKANPEAARAPETEVASVHGNRPGLRERWASLQGWHERLSVGLGVVGAATLLVVALPPFWALVRFLFIEPPGAEPAAAAVIATSLAVVALLALSTIEALVVTAICAALGRHPGGFAGLATIFVVAAALVGSHGHLPLPVSAPLAAIASLGALCSVWALSTALRSPSVRP